MKGDVFTIATDFWTPSDGFNLDMRPELKPYPCSAATELLKEGDVFTVETFTEDYFLNNGDMRLRKFIATKEKP